MSFHDVRFPDDISRGLTVRRSFNTLVLASESGFEQRIGQWARSRVEFELSLQVYNETTIERIRAFFEARQGRLYGFRCRDWSDFYVGYTKQLGSSAWPLGTPHVFATGNGTQTVFQLQRRYESGSTIVNRKVTRPLPAFVPAPFRLWVGGVEQTSGWTLNSSTGVVTFTSAPANGAKIAWAGLFDLPVRFDTDSLSLNLEALNIGATSGLRIIEIRE